MTDTKDITEQLLELARLRGYEQGVVQMRKDNQTKLTAKDAEIEAGATEIHALREEIERMKNDVTILKKQNTDFLNELEYWGSPKKG